MRRFAVVAVAVAIALLTTACEMDGGTATLTVKLTDAPVDADSIEKVWVTFTGVELVGAGAASGEDTSWELDPELGVDLLELTNGNTTTLLDAVPLPAGTYSQMRFTVALEEEGAGAPATPASYVTVDGQNEALFVPSGAQSGYKAVFDGAVDVPANGEVSFVVDWDVRKALVEAGSRYILKPTFRVVVEDQAGRIAGSITNPGTEPLVVFAYAAGTYEAEEADAPTGEDSWFPGAISSDLVEDDGTGEYGFQIWYLAEGDYDLVVASYDDDLDTYTVVASPLAGSAVYVEELSGVTVVSGETTGGISITL